MVGKQSVKSERVGPQTLEAALGYRLLVSLLGDGVLKKVPRESRSLSPTWVCPVQARINRQKMRKSCRYIFEVHYLLRRRAIRRLYVRAMNHAFLSHHGPRSI
jgi:hypothetical protein